MKIIEISKKYCKEFYNGNYKKAVQKREGVIFDDTKTKKSFNFGNGTPNDLKTYIKNNKSFCVYYDLDNKCFL